MDMMQDIAREPLWLQAWVYWLMIANTAAILFVIQRPEARWILAAWLANVMIIMPAFYETFGYTRILGVAHIIVWAPLLVYLWDRRERFDTATWAGRYLWVLFATNLASVVIDYVDLARYLSGDTPA